MKKATLLAVLLCAGVAFGYRRSTTESQALTRAAPTLATEGLDLDKVTHYQVTVCAETSRTLSGAGTLAAYWYNPGLAAWVRTPGLDLTVSATAVRCMSFPQSRVNSGLGRVLYAATGVTVSAGTTVDVRVDGFYGT